MITAQRLSASAILLMVMVSGSWGQITLTKQAFPRLHDRFAVTSITLTREQVPYLLFYPGVVQFDYDLSYLKPGNPKYEVMEDPKDLTGGTQVKEAEYGFEYSYGTGFFANTGDSVLMVGLSPNINTPMPLTFVFDSGVVFMQAPVTYPGQMQDSTTSSLQIPFFYDIKAKMVATYEVTGHGSLTLPGDTTFQVIRLKRVMTFTAIAKQLLTQTVDTLVDSLVTFEFYTEGYANTVLRAEVEVVDDGLGNLDTVAVLTFFNDPTVAINKNIHNPLRHLHHQFGQLVGQCETPGLLTLYNLSGQAVANASLAKGYVSVPIGSLSCGLYTAVFLGHDGSTYTQRLRL
ncbi:MAG: hypothetical protein HYZ16_07645 [Bacteroidetes bacterium]|jgi:hypothetical protein|nr:hypothetical protein [Bacteroidota bacterium]